MFVVPDPKETDVIAHYMIRTWALTTFHAWLLQVGMRALIPGLREPRYRPVQRVPIDFDRKYTSLFTATQELKEIEISFTNNRQVYVQLRYGLHCHRPVYPEVPRSYSQLVPRKVQHVCSSNQATDPN